jgi:glucose-1-phosphate thymidylyltransferase
MHRQGLKIACLEEIGWRQNWLDQTALETQIKRLGKSGYGKYLQNQLLTT